MTERWDAQARWRCPKDLDTESELAAYCGPM
jgi:hypothetical protein